MIDQRPYFFDEALETSRVQNAMGRMPESIGLVESRQGMDRFGLSARAPHVAEAIQYRTLDRKLR